jgi:YidC/Oxa1 family membrane protein insertase
MSTEAIEKVKELATSLGYQAAEGRAVYDQIYLAKFVHQNWPSFEAKLDQFPRLIDLDYNFLGLDLADTARNVIGQFPGGGWAVWGLLLMPIVAALAQLLMSVVTMKGSGTADNGSGKTMMYMMPLLTIWMGYSFPAALMVYWIANALFSTVQELILNKKFNEILDREETDKEREKREKRYAKYEQQKAMMQQRGGSQQPQGSKKKQAQRKEQQRKGPVTTEAGKIGGRPYARGRSYSEDHYSE